jgi:prophage DNA circulation protein
MAEEQDKKTRGTSIRLYEDTIQKISEVTRDLGVSQADLMEEWRKSYERLRLEENNSQGENLKSLRNYTDKIINLFTSMSETTQESVLNEQGKAIQSEKRYEDQVIKTDKLKNDYETKLKDQEKELKRLSKELEKYAALEESTEGRIQDKEEIIRSKDKDILSLTKEITDSKEEIKNLQEFKKREILLKNDIENLNDALKQKDLDTQRKLLDLRQELQDSFGEKIQSIYDAEAEKREKARNELENRIRAEHKAEIERIREEQQNEINRIRDEHQEEIQRIRTELTKPTKGK